MTDRLRGWHRVTMKIPHRMSGWARFCLWLDAALAPEAVIWIRIRGGDNELEQRM